MNPLVVINKSKFLRKETFTKADNIFFDDLLAMMATLTSVMFSTELVRTKASPIIGLPNHKLKDEIVIPYQAATLDKLYVYEAYEPLLKLADNQAVESIHFLIYENRPAPSPSSTVHQIVLPWRLDQAVMGAFYISFFEGQLDNIKAKFSSDTTAWPTDLVRFPV